MTTRLTLAEINAIHREQNMRALAEGPKANVDAAVLAAFGIVPTIWHAKSEAERNSLRRTLADAIIERIQLHECSADNAEPVSVADAADDDDQPQDDHAEGDGAEDGEIIHGEIDFDSMTKVKLKTFAKENLGIELDMALNKAELIDQIKALLAARETQE